MELTKFFGKFGKQKLSFIVVGKCLVYVFIGSFRSFSDTNNSWNVFCTGAKILFLTAAKNNRRQKIFFPCAQESYAFWSMKFMPRHREEVNSTELHVDVDISICLYSIGMKQNTSGLTEKPDGIDGECVSCFIVYRHNRNKPGVSSERLCKLVHIEIPTMIY